MRGRASPIFTNRNLNLPRPVEFALSCQSVCPSTTQVKIFLTEYYVSIFLRLAKAHTTITQRNKKSFGMQNIFFHQTISHEFLNLKCLHCFFTQVTSTRSSTWSRSPRRPRPSWPRSRIESVTSSVDSAARSSTTPSGWLSTGEKSTFQSSKQKP